MRSPYRILTFDVVGTLMDFEQGILDCLHAQLEAGSPGVGDQQLLEAYARAEDVQGAHRLVALTNAGREASREMAATLGEPFDDIVTVEDVGVNKPDPQVFAYCRGRQSVYGYQLSDYLHVAQSQYHDIGVAKNLGYQTAWVGRRAGDASYGGTPRPKWITAPDYHVTTLAELVDVLS